MEPIRLNRLLAQAGVCSRRAADERIAAGRVVVDGVVITEMGTKVDPDRQTVVCDGETLKVERKVHVAYHKPRGVVCTTADDERRPTVLDELPEIPGRLFTVGRLDADSTGLILVTNDGAFAQKVAHPSNGVLKTYEVTVRGEVTDAVLTKLRNGVYIGDVTTAPADVSVRGRRRDATRLRIVLQEGRNREIRRMCAHVGHSVLSIRRVRIGPLRLGDLAEGRWRYLTAEEIRAFTEPSDRRGRSR
ncbi:MAG: pseudouridine synthase [Planctomycetes bacterium]|nr:pseudouridine synthase [Planctomycetota bacterium]